MKGSTVVAAAVAVAGGAAARIHGRHAGAHDLFRKADAGVCVPECTTIYSTFYGEPTLVLSTPAQAPTSSAPVAAAETPVAPTEPKTTSHSEPEAAHPSEPAAAHPSEPAAAPSSEPAVVHPTEPAAEAPTPNPVTVTAPGTYTIPATTLILTEPTVIGTPAVEYPPGTYAHPQIVTTITVPSTVFYCPYTNVEGDKAEPTTASAAAAVTTHVEAAASSTHVEAAPSSAKPVETTAKPVETSAKPAETTAEPVETSTKAVESSATSSKSKPKPSSVPTGQLGGGSWYAMTYTPYTSDKVSRCKTSSEVRSDIEAISKAGFRAVRVYSTECETLTSVGAAVKEFGLEMIVGVFVKEDGCSYETTTIRDQVDEIASWAQWDLVPLIVVGNEAHLSGKCSTQQLATLFTTVKSKCQGAGYTGPFTVAETTNVWQDKEFAATLCDLVDVTGGNVHPYFNPETEASVAGTFVKGQLELLDAVCPGKQAFNLECGWPTSGNCQGLACPGTAEQSAALANIVAEAGSRTVFFSYANDNWKEPGACNCENSWGCGSLFESSAFTARI